MEKYKSNLKELRQAAGLTLDELADENGIGKRTIITSVTDDRQKRVRKKIEKKEFKWGDE